MENKGKIRDNLRVGARGGAIAFILKVANTALAFLNQIILARILGAGGIGEVVLVITVVRIAVQIAKFGMEETMMKFVPLYIDRNDPSLLKGTIKYAVRFCMLFSLAFMALVILSYKIVAINMFHSEGLLKLLPVIAIAIPAWVIRDVIGGILKGYKDTLRALIPESIVAPFFKVLIFLLLTLSGISPFYAIVAFVIGEFLAALTSVLFLLYKTSDLKAVRARCENKKILDVAYTIIFTGMSVLLYTQADIWILGMYTTTSVVGIYGVASKLVLLVYFPMMAFASIVPSIISSVHASEKTEELRKVIRESTRWILSMAMPIILILSIEGEYLLKYVYGLEFTAGYIPLLILVLGQIIKASAGLIGIILQMTGEHKIYMKINIIMGVVNIVLNVILVPRFGMIGAAIATALCLSLVDIVCIFIIHKRLKIITLAKGMSFDIIFISAVAATYYFLSYYKLYIGHHILLVSALFIYMWKSFVNHDIPWQLLIAKQEEV